jgi:hypothetical protein
MKTKVCFRFPCPANMPLFRYLHSPYVDLDIVRVGDMDTRGTYVFEVKHFPKGDQFRNAVFFARQQLLQEVAKRSFNVLLLERYVLAYQYCMSLLNESPLSWNLTLYRRGKQYRVEVRYNGRPAEALGKVPSRRPPPFIRVLDAYHLSL